MQYTNQTLVAVDEEDSSKIPVAQEGESSTITATPTNGGDAIAKANLTTLVASLYDESTNTLINSRDEQDVLDANNGVVSAAGVLTLRLGILDNAIVSTTLTSGKEAHILRLKWTWNDGVEVRTGKQNIRIYVEKLSTPA